MAVGPSSRVPVHLHANLVSAFLTLLEVLIALIPIKMLAAKYEGKSALASAVLNVL